jgi:Holliday junction DNA helicase RuvA
VMATPTTLATLHRGSEARLITAMIVREDSQTLYGFADTDARDLFLTLLSVSGVGPKIALATLAVYDAPSLRQALADGDVTALTRVPGIGKRGAERMVLELRDKIGAAHAATGAVALNGHSVRGPVVEALVGLGFALKQAEEATDKVLANEPEATTSSALRSALSMLGKQ